jgi:hypothetical protein
MSTRHASSTEEFLASIKTELKQAFSARPDFGSVGFRCFFREGQLARVEFEFSISKLIQSGTEKSK